MRVVRSARVVTLAVLLAMTGCGSDDEDDPAAPTASSTPPRPSSTTSTAQDVTQVGCPMLTCGFTPLEAGSYFIDPDLDPSTPLRVLFDIPTEGWQRWIGAAKFSDSGHVAVSITTVSNVVSDGCSDHSWTDPPIGQGVDDLAEALTALAPFEVTSAPQDVSMYGYPGVHLAWTVPDLPFEAVSDGDGTFTDCADGDLMSWVAAVDTEPGDAFYGYTGPGYLEEFWLLDVDGTRVMIAAEQSAGAPVDDLEELRTILDSIRIEP